MARRSGSAYVRVIEPDREAIRASRDLPSESRGMLCSSRRSNGTNPSPGRSLTTGEILSRGRARERGWQLGLPIRWQRGAGANVVTRPSHKAPSSAPIGWSPIEAVLATAV
jgi:hypothetical protein